MASVVIQGDTSGSVTLQAPAVAGSTTVNLPSTIGNAGTSAVVTTDASGNVGVGVTPSAWNSNRKVLQIQKASLVGTDGNETNLGANYYWDGSNNRYIASAHATLYNQGLGSHVWYNASSGTAGNAISFTQAMTLDASGNLIVGGTSAVYTNAPRGNITINGSTQALLGLSTGGSGRGYLYSDGSRIDLMNTQNDALTFGTNNAERGRFTSAGEFWVAGTTDQGAYNIQCNGTGVWGAGAYVNGSDARIKDDIKPLPSSLSVVQNLNPVTFRYKESWSKDTSVQPGFIAQELKQALAGQEYIDGVVMQGPEYMSVAYQTLIPVLTKAIQEQQALIEQLTTRIAALEAK